MLPEFEKPLEKMDPAYREKMQPILEEQSRKAEEERKRSAELAARVRRAIEEHTRANRAMRREN